MGDVGGVQEPSMAKRVLLLVIDALSPHVFLPAVQRGDLPTFAKLIERGSVNPECCSVFPSITHACLSSIATGEYPIEHRVIGTFWYEPEEKQIAYYGAQPWVVLNQGVNKFLEDLLRKWNEERLACDTIFETVERAGRKAACLNHLVYRGVCKYDVHEPFALKLLPMVGASATLRGPSTMFLGDFIKLTLPDGRRPKKIPKGVANRFGMCDESTLAALGALAGTGQLPDLTVAYFPDNDILSHKDGPRAALIALKKIDWGLEVIFEMMGGIDQVLEDFTILITGDHAQVDMREGEEFGGIRLDEVLEGFRAVDAGSSLDEEHDLLIAPNLRAAFIYCNDCTLDRHTAVVDALLNEGRVDQVLWQADVIEPGQRGYWVATADRGRLHFWQGNGEANTARDAYGCEWSWEGDLKALDVTVEEDQLIWGDYPNAFERIACGMGPAHAGHIWATARLGHGFSIERIKSHAGGGSHASLHRGDSFVPFVAAGLPEGVAPPRFPRIVDLAPLALKVLGLPTRDVDEPRFREVIKEPVAQP